MSRSELIDFLAMLARENEVKERGRETTRTAMMVNIEEEEEEEEEERPHVAVLLWRFTQYLARTAIQQRR